MKSDTLLRGRRRTLLVALVATFFPGAGYVYLYGQGESGFPEGYDAIQAAPQTHKVLFENEFVRVLEVSVPSTGKTVPMHHHRWPSFFLDWDTGGRSPHIRYHRPDGTVRDVPSKDMPKHSGEWSIHWMKPEPMHSIEVVENSESASELAREPSELRIEIKCHPLLI